MEDKSNIQILREFARSTKRTIEVNEYLYPLKGIRAIQKFRRMVYIPNNPENTSFFVWFNDPYFINGPSHIFNGAFIPLSSKINSKLKIRKQDFLDRINLFSKSNQIGSNNFDSKVVISGKMDKETKRLLSQSRLQMEIIKALEIENLFFVSINEYKFDFVPKLNKTPHLSIVSSGNWETRRRNIENIFDQIEKIRERIN